MKTFMGDDFVEGLFRCCKRFGNVYRWWRRLRRWLRRVPLGSRWVTILTIIDYTMNILYILSIFIRLIIKVRKSKD